MKCPKNQVRWQYEGIVSDWCCTIKVDIGNLKSQYDIVNISMASLHNKDMEYNDN